MAESSRSFAQFQTEFCGFPLAAELQPSASLLAHLIEAPAELVSGSRTEAGMHVYRNNVIHSLTQALAARFPVVRKLVVGALGFLVVTGVIQFLVFPEAWTTQIPWLALLLYLLKHGAGRFSLDYLFSR